MNDHHMVALRFRAPKALADAVEQEASKLGLDRSSYLRMTMTQKLQPAASDKESAA